MQIALRSIKIVASLSEETLCFTASLYLDGQPAGTVSNRGNGGGHEYHDWSVCRRIQAYAETLPKRVLPDTCGLGEIEYQPSADTLIDDLVTDHQMRVAPTDLAKRLKTRVLFTNRAGRVMQTGVLKGLDLGVAVEHYQRNKPHGCVIVLNALPFDEALAIYRAA